MNLYRCPSCDAEWTEDATGELVSGEAACLTLDEAAALASLVALVQAAEAVSPVAGRHWTSAQSQALADALARVLGDERTQGRGALVARVETLTAERDECRKAFRVGHKTLMAMQARVETAEARLETLEAALREMTRLAADHEYLGLPMTRHIYSIGDAALGAQGETP